MQILKIKTTRTRDGFRAWLVDDPDVKASSTSSEHMAAQNLALRVFVGHNHMAQISEEMLSKIEVKRVGGGTFRAIHDK
ncbi:MAG TPA: hypothetical protein VF659_09240 [Pyrinomonadaceae bacterium]|jgi:hypothetical protein